MQAGTPSGVDISQEKAWLRCAWCGEERPLDLRPHCHVCGGTLEVRDSGPVGEGGAGLWDYASALPVPRRVSLGEGGTPLIQLERLGTDDRIYVKAEWMNPTGSFKDRGSAVAISAAVELGARGVVCASTGNNAASVSAYAARAGLPCLVVLPADTSAAKIFQARLHGATIIEVDGTFSDAYRVAAELNDEDPRWANLTSTFLNPYMTAAHATIAWELIEDLGRPPGTIVIPIGAGPMLVGIRDGLDRVIAEHQAAAETVLVGVQPAGCSPIARAFESGAQDVAPWTSPVVSCAGSINDPLTGYEDDGTRTLRAVRGRNGVAIAVTDKEILTATGDLGASEGVDCEPAAAASLAALRRLDAAARLPRPVVLIGSGHALKDTAVPTTDSSVRVSREVHPRDLLHRCLSQTQH